MKNTPSLSVTALGAVLISLSFMNCTSEPVKPVKPVISEVVVPEVIVEKKMETHDPIVFIAGLDRGESTYYKSARTYYLNKNYQVVDNAFSLQEILMWLDKNANDKVYGSIHIVSKSSPWKGLALETLIKGEKVTEGSVRKAITQGTLPKLTSGITSATKVIFHANGLGSQTELMKTLKDAFVAQEVPSVIASPYVEVFGGEFSEHYLAKPFYGFYPTAQSPGNVDLSKEFAKMYKDESEIDWYEALTNEKERYVGEAYSYKYNIPVEFKVDFSESDSIPTFNMPEEIMDWIDADEELSKTMQAYNIPLEKFRWNAVKKENTLIIRGKTTVICILKPLIKPYGDLEHIEPDTDNLRLYALK